MKNILIPIELDHPEEQRSTVIYGAKLAAEINMGLLLAFISNSKAYGYAAMWSMAEASTRFDPARLISEEEEEIEKTLMDYEKEIKKTLMDYEKEINKVLDLAPPVNFQILSNSLTEKLVKNPEKNEIELIIICRSNLIDRPFFSADNIKEQMLNDSHTPVIVHPPDREFTTVNKILFATNFHPFDLVVLSKLSILFDKHKTEITALHITEDLNFEKKLKEAGYSKTIKSKIQNKSLNIKTMVAREKSSIPNNIRSFAYDKDIDIIVVLKERKKFLARVMQPSVTYDLINKSELPLMVFSMV